LIRTATQIPHPRWLVRGAAVAATVVALILSAPLIWVAVSAGLGLVALAGLALTGTLLFQALPLLGQTLENRLLKLRKAQARTNPIEQLQMEVLRRAERLTAFRKALATVGGQIESITQMLDERRHKDPNHVLERQQRALQRLRQFQQVNLNRLAEAQSALEEFRCTVERKNSEWTIALAIDDTAQLLDPNAAEHLMQDLLTDTALRSVQDRFNTVFAELDIQMRSVDAPTSELLSEQGYERLDLLTVSEPATSRRTS
jgi:hypothetical protein